MSSQRIDRDSGTLRNVRNEGDGILRRLLRDGRAATMPMMAIAIIPLAGLVGGAVDMSRLYITKTRLQQACDAGALAGRKVMGGGLWTASNNAANTAAERFFDTNFENGAYGTTGRTRSFQESAGRVTGTATATVPMTITKIFNQQSTLLTVNCAAEMRLPNTDIMFVLDTTGSMDQILSGDTNKKIVTLKFAVKCFYETVARLPTTADCGADPSGGVGSQTQVRFGFVPYATNVNVGRLLPTSYIADSWYYQTRQPLYTQETTYEFESENGTPTVIDRIPEDVSGTWVDDGDEFTGLDRDACTAKKPEESPWVGTGPESAPYEIEPVISGSTRTVTWKTSQSQRKQTDYQVIFTPAKNKNGTSRCQVQKRTGATRTLIRIYQRIDTGTARTRDVFSQWRYGRLEHNISGLKNGTAWRSSFTLPIASGGANKTITWDGCIEERATEKLSDYSSSTAKDLNIDLLPNASDATTMWGPALPGVIYERKKNDDNGSHDRAQVDTTAGYNDIDDDDSYINYNCPTAARKLQVWPVPAAGVKSDYENYVDSLTTDGNTHHDIGLIWGARFMSPTGIFTAENRFTPQGGEIERHMIFMTDGQTCTNKWDYDAYGVPWYDRRQTDDGSSPSDGCSSDTSNGGALSQQIDARFAAMCTRVKNLNITLWVVYFGTTDTSTVARMTACASPDRFYYANNSAALLTSFSAIAAQISQLRLTQ